jgi:hypothetical protein
MEIHRKRETKVIKQNLLSILEPFIALVVIAIFVFPTLAVINMTPNTKSFSDVLGAQTSKLVKIDVEDSTSALAAKPYIDNVTDNSFRIGVNVSPLTSGDNKFKMFTIRNISTKDVKILVTGSLESSTQLEMGFIQDSGKLVIQSNNGTLFTKEIVLPASESKNFEVYISSELGTNYTDKLNINISAREY